MSYFCYRFHISILDFGFWILDFYDLRLF